MKWKAFAVAAAAALTCAAWTQSASATVLLSDNFDSENGGSWKLNYYDFTNFYVSNEGSGGAVDLIGAGSPFDFYPGNGLYVDICGTASICGDLTTKQTFAPGTYTVTLSLGGNARDDGTDETLVSFGGTTNTYTLSEFETETVTQTYTLTSPGQLTISDQGTYGPDIGNILFSVLVASGVPEPSLWATMLLGVGMAGSMLRMTRRRAGFAI